MRYVLSSKIYSVERKRFRTVNPEAIPAKEPPAPDLLGGIGELDSPRNLRLLRAAFWAIAILAGFLQAWAARFAVTPDGTCYLDIASAYLRGDWHNALNSYWSPFFSWLLALAMGIFHPVPYWESTLLHFVNFAGFLVALATFEFFFRSLLRLGKDSPSSEHAEPALPEFGWWLLGYGLFLSTTLSLLPATYTTPDIWVSAFTYIVAGLVLRIRIAGGGWRQLAFAITVDQVPQFFWQGENGSGVPTHSVRQLLAHPHIFEFASPIGGTYPPAFDQPYWMEGVRPHLRLPGLLRVLRQSAGTLFQIYQVQLEYAVLSLAFFFAAASRAAWWKLFRRQAYFWLPPLVACSSYAIVLVEFRYVAPFVLLLWLAAISSFLSMRSEIPRRFLFALILAAVCVTGLKDAKLAVSDLLAIRSSGQNVDWEVAQALGKLNLQLGDSVAGLSRVAESHWARLAGVRIVAEIPLGDEDIFWESSPEAKQKVFRILAGTGAKMVVTKFAPPSAANEGWIPLGNTSFYVHPLAAGASANSTDRKP